MAASKTPVRKKSAAKKKATTTPARRRGPQQRAEETRCGLLDTAIELFTSQGYDGVSVRALETDAKAQRGAVAYHFGTKEDLWKAAVGRILERFTAHLTPLVPLLDDMDEEARIRTVVTAFVRFSAEMPELSRLIIQEGRHDSWRLRYLVDSFIRDRFSWLEGKLDLLTDPHTYYMAIGAATLVFDVEYECRNLFDVDPTTDEFIREHAARVADMVIYFRNQERMRDQ